LIIADGHAIYVGGRLGYEIVRQVLCTNRQVEVLKKIRKLILCWIGHNFGLGIKLVSTWGQGTSEANYNIPLFL